MKLRLALVAAIGFAAYLFVMANLQRKHDAELRKEILSHVCQGQCQFGDSKCNEECAERGYCPVRDHHE